MKIAGVACAFPRNFYPQSELLAALREHWRDKLPNPRMLDQFFTRSGVESRHLVFPLEKYFEIGSFGETNNAFIEAAVELGEQAICRALARGGYDRSQIGALFFVSVTGVANPSIDARLMNRMHLPHDVKRMPIFGLGCVAGAAGIARASDYVRAFPDRKSTRLNSSH